VRKYEKIEKDGEQAMRWTFADSVRAFDLDAGKLLREWKHSPPRGIFYLQVSPDGKYFTTLENLSGEYSSAPTQAHSLWNVETGEHRDILDHLDDVPLFSPDGKSALASFYAGSGRQHRVDCLKILDFPACTERTRIPIADDTKSMSLLGFVADGKNVLGITTSADNKSTVRLWDAASGNELQSFPAHGEGEKFSGWAWQSLDRQWVAIDSTAEQHAKASIPAALSLLDLKSLRVRRVELGVDVLLHPVVFHPSGKWACVAAAIFPPSSQSDPNVRFTALPQPTIEVIDVATGKIVESIRAPQCFLNSMAFSPDGKTLATSGPGEVLLWDFASLPGNMPATR
jgi:WD40 repeat protein